MTIKKIFMIVLILFFVSSCTITDLKEERTAREIEIYRSCFELQAEVVKLIENNGELKQKAELVGYELSYDYYGEAVNVTNDYNRICGEFSGIIIMEQNYSFTIRGRTEP